MTKLNKIKGFIETNFNIKLTSYQVEMLDAIIKGHKIYTPPCCGRSTLYRGYALYLLEKESSLTEFDYVEAGRDKNYFDSYFLASELGEEYFINKETLDKLKKDMGEVSYLRRFEGVFGNEI